MKLRNPDIFILIELETNLETLFSFFSNILILSYSYSYNNAIVQPRIIKILHKHLHSLVLFAALHIFSQTTSISPTELFDGRPVKPLLPGNTKENQTNKCGKDFPQPGKNQILLANWVFGISRWHVLVCKNENVLIVV